MDFSQRSPQKELLDSDNIPFADIQRNMKELAFINTYLGGHAITIDGVKRLVDKNQGESPLVICEIGCGGGDNIRAIARWCKRKKIKAAFIGIDINPECIEVARQNVSALSCSLIASDYSLAIFKDMQPDIIFSSLFCHHFSNEELTRMLGWMHTNARKGFFINDLHRHWLAYYSIKGLTQLFSSSYLVKNDAPLSVRRGFLKQEWEQLLNSAGLQNFLVKWKWAFRHLVVVPTGKAGLNR